MQTLHPLLFKKGCDLLANLDPDFQEILRRHGYPPLWSRKPGFETLIHIILEQQVSLASAKAALDKLLEKTGTLNPEKLLALSDEELRVCYFSRQKMGYARHLAQAICDGSLDLNSLETQNEEGIRRELTKIKGIGNWTAEIYLIMALQHADIFPVGDLAIVQSLKKLKGLPAGTSREEMLLIAERWRPYRSIAAMMLWHLYLCQRNIRL